MGLRHLTLLADMWHLTIKPNNAHSCYFLQYSGASSPGPRGLEQCTRRSLHCAHQLLLYSFRGSSLHQHWPPWSFCPRRYICLYSGAHKVCFSLSIQSKFMNIACQPLSHLIVRSCSVALACSRQHVQFWIIMLNFIIWYWFTNWICLISIVPILVSNKM